MTWNNDYLSGFKFTHAGNGESLPNHSLASEIAELFLHIVWRVRGIDRVKRIYLKHASERNEISKGYHPPF